jgi:tRNA A-37 threonylcarbamoyl transferase component Bud32
LAVVFEKPHLLASQELEKLVELDGRLTAARQFSNFYTTPWPASMTANTSTVVCPQCGSERPSDLNEPCPGCLLKAAAGNDSEAPPVVAPTLSSSYGQKFTPPTPAELDQMFPNLEIQAMIGCGGMGAVYRARQPELDRTVAVKILPRVTANAEAYEQRFLREARALARLNHPNIITVFDFGKTEGLHYFVMEYVDGVTLRDVINGGQLTAKDALAIVSQLCDSLQFAHDEGIVHRDIKPENILVDQRGRVKVADFGLAKLVGQDAATDNLTATQQVMGTMRYMAPEQMSGTKQVDHRADIYSLGVVFYELLTRELPLGWFAPPSKKATIDVRLDEVVLRTLESEPSRRYQQASELKSAVQVISASADPRPMATEQAAGTPDLAASSSSINVHKLLDVTDTKNRRLYLVTTIIATLLLNATVILWLASGARPLAAQASLLKGLALAAGIACLATGFYAHRVKQRQRWTVFYKGHQIVFDNSSFFAERLYLDEGLVRHGGFGMKMEIRTTIKAGEGLGDEIIVWFDARLLSCRCRIVVEEKRRQ